MSPTVAVLGTGIMGSGIARSLLRAGLEVTVWNRSTDKAKPLADDGATVADSAAAAVRGADVVLTMLFDADAVADTMGPVLAEMGPDAVWAQCSTVGVDGTDRLAGLAAEHGVAFLDTPVVGTKQPAEKGELVVLVSGPPDAADRAAPVFDAIGSQTRRVGDDAGSASRLKLVVNAWLATVVNGVAQSVALAGDLGLDPQLFLDAISGQALDSPYAQLKGSGMVDGDFEPSFALDGVLKDAGLIREAAGTAGTGTGLLDAMIEKLRQASSDGHGEQDAAAVVEAYRAR
ncbi:MAG: NAD(P)-dependent oxidoreductase [Pseudonocardia sediminis]